jgi:hypothetical protein
VWERLFRQSVGEETKETNETFQELKDSLREDYGRLWGHSWPMVPTCILIFLVDFLDRVLVETF